MKPVAGGTSEAWQERAGTRRDRGVDRGDAVDEARDDLVQLVVLSDALNSRGIVGAGNPGRFAATSWWSRGDSN